MNYNELHSELFDQYLGGNLGTEAVRAFEQQLSDDAAFSEAFRIHKLLKAGIQDYGRESLKQHLKENGKMQYWGDNFWPKSMRFAAAAVLIIFLGLYAVVKRYLQPLQKPELAVKTESRAPVNTGTADSVYPPAIYSPDAPPDIAVVTAEPERIESEIMEDVVAMDDMSPSSGKNYGQEAEGTDDAGYEEIKVLSESMLSDTLYTVPVISWADANRSKTYYDNLSKPASRAETAQKKKALSLPANASNANQSTALEGKDNDKDSVGSGVTGSKKAEAEQSSSSRYKIEFWFSPVNFKGYRLTGKSIRLYGVDVNEARFYVYKAQLYLYNEGRVYILGPCPYACAFTAEPDQDVVNIILNQTR